LNFSVKMAVHEMGRTGLFYIFGDVVLPLKEFKENPNYGLVYLNDKKNELSDDAFVFYEQVYSFYFNS